MPVELCSIASCSDQKTPPRQMRNPANSQEPIPLPHIKGGRDPKKVDSLRVSATLPLRDSQS